MNASAFLARPLTDQILRRLLTVAVHVKWRALPPNRMLSGMLHLLAWQAKLSGHTYVGYSLLIHRDDAQEAAVNRQRAVARVIDKAQCPELVHEMTDPRPGGADHLGQVLLINSGMDRFGSAFLAKMCQQQENPGQAFLAGVEKLVDQILFIANVAGEQVRHEQFRDTLLLVEQMHHQRPLDSVESAIRQQIGRASCRER